MLYIKEMKEYSLIIEGDTYYLLPLGEEKPSYAIKFNSKEMAHEYKLALALGTYPTRKKSPKSYEACAENYNNIPTYITTGQRDKDADEVDSSCCESGCPGCPWTLEQIRRGNL